MGSYSSPRSYGKGGTPKHISATSEKKDVGLTQILKLVEKISRYQEAIENEKGSIKRAEEQIDYYNKEIENQQKTIKEALASLDEKTKALLASSGIIINTDKTLNDLIDENKSFREANEYFKHDEKPGGR